MSTYTEIDAWQAMDKYDPTKALKIWEQLIATETLDEKRDELRSNSCYALIALESYDLAREIYLELFKKYQTHLYAHQLCMVEREAGNYQKALNYLDVEAKLIDESDSLARAGNLYEYGKLNELLGNLEQARSFAKSCLELSSKCDDLILLACANRLLGDVHRHRDIAIAEVYYLQAQKLFYDAGDTVGVDEIDDLIADL